MRLKSPTDTPIHVALLSGHAISIGPQGREVPTMFYREALMAGGVPDGMEAADMDSPVPEPTDQGKPDLIRNGIRKMLETPDQDFTGSGLPDRRVLSKLVGWNVTAVELGEVWPDFVHEVIQTVTPE